MKPFHYQDNALLVEATRLEDIAAQYGTPCYVYSKGALIHHFQAFESALKGHPHQICYAVKANPSLAILHLFATLGAGFDVVSAGELERVLRAGGRADKTVFSGVGKSSAEIHQALAAGIQCINVESLPELLRIHAIAKERGNVAPIGLRMNPDVDAKTHPHITTGFRDNKFGIAAGEIPDIINSLKTMPHVRLIGMGSHIGSQLTTLDPLLAAADKVLSLVSDLAVPLEHIDLGGGLGVCYKDETPPSIQNYASALRHRFQHSPHTLLVEPGRALTAEAGVLLTRVEYIKRTPNKHFVIVDAGMNDLLRPALYDAWHRISPVLRMENTPETTCDIVGPVCESADFLGKDRQLAATEGALLAIHMAGAYSASMGSTYNSRPRPPEILVDKNAFHLIRAREKITDLFQHETLLDEMR